MGGGAHTDCGAGNEVSDLQPPACHPAGLTPDSCRSSLKARFFGVFLFLFFWFCCFFFFCCCCCCYHLGGEKNKIKALGFFPPHSPTLQSWPTFLFLLFSLPKIDYKALRVSQSQTQSSEVHSGSQTKVSLHGLCPDLLWGTSPPWDANGMLRASLQTGS